MMPLDVKDFMSIYINAKMKVDIQVEKMTIGWSLPLLAAMAAAEQRITQEDKQRELLQGVTNASPEITNR